MNHIESKRRRELLMAAGACAAQLLLPSGPARAAALLTAGGRSKLRMANRYKASVVQNTSNPYFIHQGGPKSAPLHPAAPASGLALSTGANPTGMAAARVAAAAAQVSTLVLYDTTGPFGWLGEIYGLMAANLASHFGSWVAMPVVSYTAGTLAQYSACIYIGSTFGEPLPAAFLTDVYTSTTPVIWMFDNIWQLVSANSGFTTKYGFAPWVFDFSTVATVTYKSQQMKRYSANAAGIMSYSSVASPAVVLAQCVRSDNTTFPWAVRSGNLTYIGEIPFAYISEGDRYLILCDLLFDALASATTTRHRALVRLEDLNPLSNTTAVQQTADWLHAQGIPFGFHITARYLDPNGHYNGGVPQDVPLSTRPNMIAAILYMQQRGGVLIHHGYTHQFSNIDNPYTGVTGDDCEFYRITSSGSTLTYVGPVPPDTGTSYALGRFSSYKAELNADGFAMPTISTFPDYAASVPDYQAAAQTFTTRAERSLYFPGVLTRQPIDYTRPVGQFFPYSVQDVYGSKVLADSLGGIDPTVFMGIPPRLPADIIADAQRTLVVRDGVASFFYNPEDPLSYLQQTVQGLIGLGYQFVSPLTL
jgi:uncharacterized protein YdaL